MLFEFILIFTALVAIILSIFNFKKQNNAIYLSCFLLILSLYGITHYIVVVHQSVFWGSILYINLTPLYLLLGPLLHLYVRQNLNPRNTLGKNDLLHLIPFVLDFIGISSYLFTSFEYKQEVLQSLYSNPSSFKSLDVNLIFKPLANYIIRIALFLGYVGYNIGMIYNFKKEKFKDPKFKETKKDSILWLTSFHFFIIITIISYVVFIINIFSSGVFFTLINSILLGISALSIAMMSLSILLYPSILYGISKVSYKQIDPEQLYTNNPYYEELQSKIDEYFITKEPFLKKNFSRVDLAKALKVPSHQITFCFKYVYESSFPAYKLKHRINWIKEAIIDPKNDDLTVEEVGKKAGFASKSSFFVSFKSHTGMTPTEYKQKYQKHF